VSAPWHRVAPAPRGHTTASASYYRLPHSPAFGLLLDSHHRLCSSSGLAGPAVPTESCERARTRRAAHTETAKSKARVQPYTRCTRMLSTFCSRMRGTGRGLHEREAKTLTARVTDGVLCSIAPQPRERKISIPVQTRDKFSLHDIGWCNHLSAIYLCRYRRSN
jgi:hypothetical protein